MFGSFVLRLFDLSIAVVQVAGGAIVCALAWRLLNADPNPAEALIDRHQASVAIAIGANHSHTLNGFLVQFLVAVIGISIITAVGTRSVDSLHELIEKAARRMMLQGTFVDHPSQ